MLCTTPDIDSLLVFSTTLSADVMAIAASSATWPVGLAWTDLDMRLIQASGQLSRSTTQLDSRYAK